MALYRHITLASAFSLIAGCTFFEQPVNNLPELTPQAPASQSNPAQPPAPVTPKVTEAATTTLPSTSAGASFLLVAPIENLPENATNIAVVHFTRKDTDRAVALCKVLSSNLRVTDIGDIPEQATNVVLWPVANDNAGGNCIEMLTDYEPIDITIDAAKRVNESAEGPFLLTQHMDSGTRMIYDMSFVSSRGLNSAVGAWKGLVSGAHSDWPSYRRAR